MLVCSGTKRRGSAQDEDRYVKCVPPASAGGKVQVGETPTPDSHPTNPGGSLWERGEHTAPRRVYSYAAPGHNAVYMGTSLTINTPLPGPSSITI